MTSPFPLQLALGQHQYEAIEKLLRVMDPNCIMVCIRAAEKMGWGNLIFLFDTVKDLSQEVVVDGIRTVSAKALGRDPPQTHLHPGGANSTLRPKRCLVQPYIMMLCNKKNKCRTQWARQGDFANHFKKYHTNAFKESNYWKCCAEKLVNEEELTKHIWETHMEFIALQSQTPTYPWGHCSHMTQSVETSHATFTSCQAPPHMSCVSAQDYTNIPGSSSYGSQQPATLHNHDYGMGTSYQGRLGYQEGLVLKHPYHTIPEDQQPYSVYIDDSSLGTAQFQS